MFMRFLMTSAAMLLIAGPAFADCSQEIETIKQAMTQAETGASSTEAGLPATQHQEQVLAGDQEGDESDAGAGGTGQADVPASPHQRQVLAGDQEGDEGEAGAGGAGQADMPATPHQQQVLAEPAAGSAASGEQAAELVAQAGDMAEAGNEEGCMQKVTEAKGLLGID
jgi:hypothetical protein